MISAHGGNGEAGGDARLLVVLGIGARVGCRGGLPESPLLSLAPADAERPWSLPRLAGAPAI